MQVAYYWIWLLYHLKNYGDQGGCYCPWPTSLADNTLLNLHNSSNDRKAEFTRLSERALFVSWFHGYAILKDFLYMFGAKFTGWKLYWWHHDNWPIGQWVIFHATPDTAYVDRFFPAWIYNMIQFHLGETSRPRDFVARSVAQRPSCTAACFAHF